MATARALGRGFFGWGLLALFGVGCAAVSRTGVPAPAQEVASGLPGDYVEGAAEGPAAGAHEPRAWWRAFGDPVLDEVVDSVLASNFSVAEGVARVQQARAQARLADAAILPVVRGSAGVETTNVPVNTAIGAQLDELGLDFPLPDRLGLTVWTLGFDFAYELDFWGRARHAALAAGSDLLASESDLRAARIGILAETIAAYFEIGHLRRQRGIAGRQLEVLAEREELVRNRYERGLASSIELYQVRQALRSAEAGLPQLENQLAGLESRLAVLLGGYRSDVLALLPESFAPAAPDDPVPAGIPADLLLQRPDVQAAGHRLEAAGHGVEARRAALMPQLSISGAIGLQSRDLGGFHPRQWFTNLASNLLRPVFDGGRLATGVELAEARFDEAAAAYARTVVTAVSEVEAALITLRNEGRRRESLAAQHEEARATVELQTERYASGVGGYADLLDTTRTFLDAEAALAASERNLALARLGIHRALGGAWTVADEAGGAPAAGSGDLEGSSSAR